MLLAADRLYSLCSTAAAGRVLVSDEPLRTFGIIVDDLANALGADVEDAVWLQVLRTLRRIRWELLTVPLPRSSPAMGLAAELPVLRNWARVAGSLRGKTVGLALQQAVDACAGLADSDETPIGREIEIQLADSMSRRLVIRSAHLAREVQDWLFSEGVATDVVLAQHLSRLPPVDLCCVAGVSRFPVTSSLSGWD